MKHKVCPRQPRVCFINPKLFNRMVHYKKISYQDCTMYIESRTFQLKGKYRARNLRQGMQSLVFTCIFFIRSNFFFVHFYYSSNACYSELNRPLSFYFVLFILYKNTNYIICSQCYTNLQTYKLYIFLERRILTLV